MHELIRSYERNLLLKTQCAIGVVVINRSNMVNLPSSQSSNRSTERAEKWFAIEDLINYVDVWPVAGLSQSGRFLLAVDDYGSQDLKKVYKLFIVLVDFIAHLWVLAQVPMTERLSHRVNWTRVRLLAPNGNTEQPKPFPPCITS